MIYHNINPTLLELGPLQVRYYGIIFALGFIISYFILVRLAKERKLNLSNQDVMDLLVYVALGVIIGSRLFYTFIYNPAYYLSKPWEIFYIWQGGLSFHGGLIGALIAAYIFTKLRKVSLLELADIAVIPLALGLFLGRIANFINAELVGRISDAPWCVKFPGYEECRHPSQLYESAKNLLIFSVLWLSRKKQLRKGALFSYFLLMYSALRFFIEFFREPDSQLGFFFGWLSMGQILSILMFVSGVVLLYYVRKRV